MQEVHSSRQRIIQAVFILGAIVLTGKAMQLQLFNGTRSERLTSAVGKRVLYPSRGLIFDRNKNLMTYNEPIYDLMVTHNQIDPQMDTSYLCEILNIDKETFLTNINKDWKSHLYSRAIPFPFMKKIPVDVYARLQESMYEFPGFSVRLRIIRGYPDTVGAHVLGYISEVNAKQVLESKGEYKGGDYIGSTGLEVAYENHLKGKKGIAFLLKDNKGRIVGPYKGGALDSAAVSGKNLITSLDIELQRYGEYLLKNKTGSIVAIEPSTGEVLSMTSAPSYDPNLLSVNAQRGKIYKELLENPLNPFFNRAVSAKYPPGSLFKPLVGLIAMEAGVWSPYQGSACSGSYWNVDREMGCHAHPYPSNMGTAIQHSCNSYFFNVFKETVNEYGAYSPQIGLDSFTQHLYDFGLGKPLELDFIGEKGGNVPTSAYYDRLYPKNKGSWKAPTIISLGIGQGELEMTTLQMANMAAIIGNRGTYYLPHLVKDFENSDRTIDEKYLTLQKTRISPEYFDVVIPGMEKVITSGTARIAYIPGIPMAGKTGTAQNPHGKDHSIFFAFAPIENPQIAIAVYVENAGFGGTYAAPIASLMIEKYINREIAENRKALEDYIRNINLIEP